MPIDDDRAGELLGAGGLDLVQHHLRTIRRFRPHLLSEPEERILAETAVTGSDAWERLFTELASAIEVAVPGTDAPVPLDVAAAQLSSPDRDHRRAVAAAITDALEPTLRTRAFVFNTLLADKATSDMQPM